MRSIILAALAATALTPVAASAQSAGEVRRDRQEVRHDQQQVRQDLRRGDNREARRDRQETREDRREARSDWRDYRRTHQDVFRRGAYVGPRGFRYRPVTVGYRFAPMYYSSRYWISDPLLFRLPRPGFNQRWIRYGNDVVLVNIRTGRVLQVYSGFFF